MLNKSLKFITLFGLCGVVVGNVEAAIRCFDAWQALYPAVPGEGPERCVAVVLWHSNEKVVDDIAREKQQGEVGMLVPLAQRVWRVMQTTQVVPQTINRNLPKIQGV